MERIVILGAQGQLGRAFCGLPWLKGLMYPQPPEIIPADLPRVDLTRIESLESFMTDAQPDALINCAAYTNVEGAQDEPDLCRRVNVEGPGHLGRICAGSGSTLVHISTDYVFNGDKTTDYTEEDPTGGLSVYGRSKADGEAAVRGSGCRYLVVRSSWLFSEGKHNFVDAILRKARAGEQLEVVSDQVGCPTYARDLAEAIVELLRLKQTGTFHFCNYDPCSWMEFAREIVEQAGFSVRVNPVKTADRPTTKAKRPAFSVLGCLKYSRLTGRVPRSWRRSLADCLSRRSRE